MFGEDAKRLCGPEGRHRVDAPRLHDWDQFITLPPSRAAAPPATTAQVPDLSDSLPQSRRMHDRRAPDAEASHVHS